MEIFNLFDQKEIYQISLTSLQADFPASVFHRLGVEKGLRTQEVLYFLKSHGFCDITSELESQSIVFYSKMLKAYLVTTMDEHLLSSTEFLPTLVIPLNANFLILGGHYPKIESEYTLSDILEEEVDAKYFLSESQVKSLTTGIQKSQVHCNTLDTLEETTKE